MMGFEGFQGIPRDALPVGNRLYRKVFLKPDGEETIAQWFARRLSDADLDVEEKYRIARIPIPHELEHAFRSGTRNPTHSTGVAHMMPIAPLMIEHRLIERSDRPAEGSPA